MSYYSGATYAVALVHEFCAREKASPLHLKSTLSMVRILLQIKM